MIRSKTLFIVGAGASCEAGLPSGHALKGKIANLLNLKFEHGFSQKSGDTRIIHYLRQALNEADYNGDLNYLLAKARRIHDIMPTTAISIDNYLDTHRDDKGLALCGKLGIVKAILDAEKSSKLRAVSETLDRFNLSGMIDTWYIGLLRLLTTNLDKSELKSIFSNIVFITFNYDRCIERFLRQGIADHYDLNDHEASELMSSLEIIHVYGQVGILPAWPHAEGTAFGDNEQSDLLSLAKGIKTFTERVDDEAMLNSIGKAISTAETIVFLGFAFAEQNMKLLATKRRVAIKRYFGTTLGLSAADLSVISSDLNQLFNNREMGFVSEVSSNLLAFDCNKTIEHYFRVLSSTTH